MARKKEITSEDKQKTTKTYKKNNKKENKGGIKLVKSNSGKYSVDENTKNLRKLYNQLMQKNKTDKSNIVSKILKTIDKKYKDICFKHDGCRILQGCIKYGSKEQKNLIINELIPELFNIINGKYSIFLGLKIFKYSSNNQKKEILKTVLIPNFMHLIKYSGGITFIKCVFTYSSIAYQNELVDLYIKNYLKIPFDDIKKLGENDNEKDNNENNEEDDEINTSKKDSNIIVKNESNHFECNKIREQLKEHLEKQLEIGAHKNFIFHGFLNRIFDMVDANTQRYIGELLNDDLLPLLDSEQGYQVSMKIYCVSSVKNKKQIIKLVKEKLDNFFNSANGINFITKIILFTDDTVIINKVFLIKILEKLTDEFDNHKDCLRIIWNILYPFNKRCNKTEEQLYLSYSKFSTTKKSLEKRQDELIANILEKTAKLITFNINFLINDVNYSNFLSDFILFCKEKNHNDVLEKILKCLGDYIENDIKTNENKIEESALNKKYPQLTIKRIMKSSENMAFLEKISEILKGNLGEFIKTKAVFLMIELVENEKTKNLIINDLKKYKNEILNNDEGEKKSGLIILSKFVN